MNTWQEDTCKGPVGINFSWFVDRIEFFFLVFVFYMSVLGYLKMY